MGLEKPMPFNMKDLSLDVSLKTCVDGHSYDFTGKKTFNTKFFQKSIGFGITDIKIDINTSLQPLIDITFKDLYGNTLFGTQRGSDSDIDTSVLFNWPPPKFIFSFKGYLGRKVTWILNLKTTNVTYISSDGSYEIKCSFVPNQWGFLSDIPALYLLACKKLRYEKYGGAEKRISDKCVFKSDSIFSFTRIGKQVDSKTQTETKEFELLSKQLTAIKYGLSNAVFNTKIIILNEPIIGIVNNIPITNFTNLMVTAPEGFDFLKKESINSSNTNKLNNYLQLNVKQAEDKNPRDKSFNKNITTSYSYKDVNKDGNILGTIGISAEKNKVTAIIDQNLELIDNEIKKRVYASTKKEIGKLTIGEVFQQLSRDSAFILGSILDAGFEGSANNKDIREGSKELIGRHFPLILNEKGEEVPAMPEMGEGIEEYGVKNYEMKFVDKFIEAIGEGIAENLVSDEIASASESKIKNRINNLEALQPNAYKSTFTNIAENILIRSGIIAYVTRSNDPSRPGDYHQMASWDRDSVEKIQELSKLDMENVTKDILGQLSYEDRDELIRFCTFFNKLLSDDGEDFLMPTNNSVNEGYLKTKLLTSETQALGDDIWNYPIAMKDINDENVKDGLISAVKQNSISGQVNSGAKALGVLTLKELLSGMIKNVPLTSAQDGTSYKTTTEQDDVKIFYNTSTIDKGALTALSVKNNGVYYSLPKANKNSYSFVFYDNPVEVLELTSIQVNDKPEDGDADGKGVASVFNASSNEPIGFIPINNSVDSKGETLGRISILNSAIKGDQGRVVVDYNKCKNYYGDTNFYVHDSSKTVETKEDSNGIPAKNLAYAVYAHTADKENFTSYVFGPFTDTNKGRNQRAAIKIMCKAILDKFDEIETEKNEILSDVLGKASEHRNSIYKQMHTIFQQWQIVASSISGKDFCQGIRLGKGEKGDFSEKLEMEYGSCENHVEKHNNQGELGGGTTIFVYDYPLASVNGEKVNVKNSIINIEALYKPNGNTTALNIIQQICTKNNFIFVPFPGDANSSNVSEIYTAFPKPTEERIRNYFHVLFTPTPETRSKLNNDTKENLTDYMNETTNMQNTAIEISFGSVYNQIIKSINVGTDSTKPTAESILNLQKLVDKENTSKKVSMDCSMLSVYEGRSYKASVEMIGNAQVYPMQYFYIKNMPMFGGLYQIMKVSHSITPNDMTTNLEGIRMRFFTGNGGLYGGVKPITLESLEKLGNVEQPMVEEVVSGSKGTYISTTDSLLLDSFESATGVAAEDFINSVRDIKFKNLNDVNTFFKEATGYGTFLEFFNSTQAGRSYYSRNENAHINAVGVLRNENLTPMMNNIELIYPGGANFFELFINWCSSLSESKGMPISESMGKTGHPEMSYLFDSIPGLKMSYNTMAGNMTVLDSLKDDKFKNKFNNANYSLNRDLFNSKGSEWAGVNMPKNKDSYYKFAENNILTHTDFAKFRGRGFVQITGRSNYRNVLKELLILASAAKINTNIISYMITNWGSLNIDVNNLNRILTTSTNAQWDYLFKGTNGSVACVAHKTFLNSVGREIKLNSPIYISSRMLAIGGSATCGCNVGNLRSNSWQREYGNMNVARVLQIIASIKK